MAVKCPSCLGEMRYDISSGQLKCIHCDTKTTIEQYEEQNQVKTYSDGMPVDGNTNVMETKRYQCPECGAEVESLEEEATIFCPYCGRQAFLSHTWQYKRPDYVVPFQINTEQIEEEYRKFIENTKFVPKEYKSENFTQEFRGVYIPFWNVAYDVDGKYVYPATHTRLDVMAKYIDHYEIDVDMTETDFVAHDASETFDDRLATAIAPFDISAAKPFYEGYCAGFYLDKENVDEKYYSELIAEEIVQQTDKRIKDAAKEKAKQKGMDKRFSVEKHTEEPRYSRRLPERVLLPVWFATKRVKDRVFYSVVNGQTGKMMMDVPVDKKSFFKTTLLQMLVLFPLCLILFSYILPFMDGASILSLMGLSVHATMAALYSQAAQIIVSERNIDNIGKTKGKEKSSLDRQLLRASGTPIPLLAIVICILIALVFLCLLFGPIIYEGIPLIISKLAEALNISWVLLCILLFLCGLLSHRLSTRHLIKEFKMPRVALSNYGSIICLFLTIISVVLHPPEWVYFLLCIPNALSIIYNIKNTIDGFDYVASRAVPNFFDRKETRVE